MVREITILNVTKQKQIEIRPDVGPYIFDSVDWDAPFVEMEKYRVPFQIGETLSGVVVGTRKPVIYGYVIGFDGNEIIEAGSIKEYYERQREAIEKYKMFLDEIINIYEDVLIKTGGYILSGRPLSPVIYSNTERENNDVLCRFLIQIECYDPMFYKNKISRIITSTEKKFHFPLVIPEDDGVIFGVIKGNRIATIENTGQVDVGMTITVKALTGSFSDFVIRNVYSGEYLGFSGLVVGIGNTLIITTVTGEENAVVYDEKTGEYKNVVGYLKTGSTFLKSYIGTTVYTYETETGLNNVEVVIDITPKFFNIRGM